MPTTGPRGECGDCQRYRAQQFNYCRVCGNHLTTGQIQWSRIRVATGYTPAEKFCGHCGGNKHRGGCPTVGHPG